VGYQIVTWPMASRDSRRCWRQYGRLS